MLPSSKPRVLGGSPGPVPRRRGPLTPSHACTTPCRPPPGAFPHFLPRLQLNLEGQLASDEYAYKHECGLRIQTGHLRLRCAGRLRGWGAGPAPQTGVAHTPAAPCSMGTRASHNQSCPDLPCTPPNPLQPAAPARVRRLAVTARGVAAGGVAVTPRLLAARQPAGKPTVLRCDWAGRAEALATGL